VALNSLHLLLTYRCTYACDHCFVWGSSQATLTMTIGQVRAVLEAAVRLGGIGEIYFEGGEPFLAYPLLLAGAREAVGRGLRFGVVTNAYWATSEEDATLWLQPLGALGMADLSLSEDRFHGDLPSPEVRHATAAARRLGLPQGVLRVELGPDCSAGGVRLRGRAALRLAGQVRLQPWQQFTACPYEDLADPGRVHVDGAGYVHLCQGLAMGRIDARPLDELVAAYRPQAHPSWHHCSQVGRRRCCASMAWPTRRPMAMPATSVTTPESNCAPASPSSSGRGRCTARGWAATASDHPQTPDPQQLGQNLTAEAQRAQRLCRPSLSPLRLGGGCTRRFEAELR